MKGFFIDDAEKIMQMDTTLNEQNRTSTFLDVKLNKPKNGVYKLKSSENLLTDKEFTDLQTYVKAICDKAVAEILSGYVHPSPIRLTDSDKTYCENCEFYGVCGVEKTKFANGRKCYTNVSMQDISNINGGGNNE